MKPRTARKSAPRTAADLLEADRPIPLRPVEAPKPPEDEIEHAANHVLACADKLRRHLGRVSLQLAAVIDDAQQRGRMCPDELGELAKQVGLAFGECDELQDTGGDIIDGCATIRAGKDGAA